MLDATPTLLLTRPQSQSERFAKACRQLLGRDLRVVISPILRIRPRAAAVDLTGTAGVILTSENGARALAGAVDVAGRKAFCVGDRTAQVARSLGLVATSAGGAAADLIALIRASAPAGPLVFAHGAETRGDIAGALGAAGIAVREVVLYDQVPADLTAAARALLAGTAPVVLPLFSPRSADLVGGAVRGASAPLAVVALSPAVAAAWSGPETSQMAIADSPDGPAMLRLIATIYAGLLA